MRSARFAQLSGDKYEKWTKDQFKSVTIQLSRSYTWHMLLQFPKFLHALPSLCSRNSRSSWNSQCLNLWTLWTLRVLLSPQLSWCANHSVGWILSDLRTLWHRSWIWALDHVLDLHTEKRIGFPSCIRQLWTCAPFRQLSFIENIWITVKPIGNLSNLRLRALLGMICLSTWMLTMLLRDLQRPCLNCLTSTSLWKSFTRNLIAIPGSTTSVESIYAASMQRPTHPTTAQLAMNVHWSLQRLIVHSWDRHGKQCWRLMQKIGRSIQKTCWHTALRKKMSLLWKVQTDGLNSSLASTFSAKDCLPI